MKITHTRARMVMLALLLAPLPAVHAAELKRFASDGCSAFPDGNPEQNSPGLRWELAPILRSTGRGRT